MGTLESTVVHNLLKCSGLRRPAFYSSYPRDEASHEYVEYVQAC